MYEAADLDVAMGQRLWVGTLEQQADCGRTSRMTAIESARALVWAGDLYGGELVARRVLNDAEWVGDRQSIAEALGVLGCSLGSQGRFGEAEPVLVRGIALATAAANVVWVSRSQALLAAFDAWQGDLVTAGKRWAQALACGPPHDPTIWASGAVLASLAGDFATVRWYAVEAEAHGAVESASALPGWLWALSVIATAESGRVEEARRRVERVPCGDSSSGPDLREPLYWWAQGVVEWAEGRLTAATIVLERAIMGCSTMGFSAPLGLILADLAEAATAAGDPDTATRAASVADDIAHRTGAPSHRALGWLTVAWASLGHGRRDEAARSAREAVDGLRSTGYLMLAARAQVVYALAVEQSEPVAAIRALRESLAMFDRCGSAVRHDQTDALLTQLAPRCRTEDATNGLVSLTVRERQVAELARRGYTARQIAERLKISTRTVETHLRRIYPKLGVSSKQQLVEHPIEFPSKR